MKRDKAQAIFERAAKVIPAGVNSNFRYWGPDETPVMSKAEGPYIWDADGNRYIDYRLGWGPIILGHSYPAVVERACRSLGYLVPRHDSTATTHNRAYCSASGRAHIHTVRRLFGDRVPGWDIQRSVCRGLANRHQGARSELGTR